MKPIDLPTSPNQDIPKNKISHLFTQNEKPESKKTPSDPTPIQSEQNKPKENPQTIDQKIFCGTDQSANNKSEFKLTPNVPQMIENQRNLRISQSHSGNVRNFKQNLKSVSIRSEAHSNQYQKPKPQPVYSMMGSQIPQSFNQPMPGFNCFYTGRQFPTSMLPTFIDPMHHVLLTKRPYQSLINPHLNPKPQYEIKKNLPPHLNNYNRFAKIPPNYTPIPRFPVAMPYNQFVNFNMATQHHYLPTVHNDLAIRNMEVISDSAREKFLCPKKIDIVEDVSGYQEKKIDNELNLEEDFQINQNEESPFENQKIEEKVKKIVINSENRQIEQKLQNLNNSIKKPEFDISKFKNIKMPISNSKPENPKPENNTESQKIIEQSPKISISQPKVDKTKKSILNPVITSSQKPVYQSSNSPNEKENILDPLRNQLELKPKTPNEPKKIKILSPESEPEPFIENEFSRYFFEQIPEFAKKQQFKECKAECLILAIKQKQAKIADEHHPYAMDKKEIFLYDKKMKKEIMTEQISGIVATLAQLSVGFRKGNPSFNPLQSFCKNELFLLKAPKWPDLMKSVILNEDNRFECCELVISILKADYTQLHYITKSKTTNGLKNGKKKKDKKTQKLQNQNKNQTPNQTLKATQDSESEKNKLQDQIEFRKSFYTEPNTLPSIAFLTLIHESIYQNLLTPTSSIDSKALAKLALNNRIKTPIGFAIFALIITEFIDPPFSALLFELILRVFTQTFENSIKNCRLRYIEGSLELIFLSPIEKIQKAKFQKLIAKNLNYITKKIEPRPEYNKKQFLEILMNIDFENMFKNFVFLFQDIQNNC